MVRQNLHELQHLTVPSFFRCPISMDVMKSPVSLCTGVTYDRASIQAWLDTGHNTCPATMQILPSTDFVPNLTLRRLIHRWSNPSPDYIIAEQLIRKLGKVRVGEVSSVDLRELFSQIADFVKSSNENRELLTGYEGFVSSIVKDFVDFDKIEEMEVVLSILDLLVSDAHVRIELHQLISDKVLTRFVTVLRRGSIASRIKSANVLGVVLMDSESKRRVGEDRCLLKELFVLACSNVVSEQAAVEAGLSCLAVLAVSRNVQKELVKLGMVRIFQDILVKAGTRAVEKALCLLERVSACTEGRTAIGTDPLLVTEVVRKIMKVSKTATEHAVAVVWSVCYLSRDVTAQEAAVLANGLTKALLVMQSDCSAGARKMCAELVKVFRVNSKSCLANYDTQTTHIMPY